MKRILFIFCLLLCAVAADAEKHDIKDFYVEISEKEAKKNGFDEAYENRYFVKTRLDKGLYEVEVGEKLDSRFYGIRFTDIFMLFRYSPYLYKYDDGIIKVTNGFNAGEFIEED